MTDSFPFEVSQQTDNDLMVLVTTCLGIILMIARPNQVILHLIDWAA